jgi:hypothetical protein
LGDGHTSSNEQLPGQLDLLTDLSGDTDLHDVTVLRDSGVSS